MITIVVIIHAELVFRLREADRSEREDNGFIEIVVENANQQDLVTNISLLLTPRDALVPLNLLEPANNSRL